MERDTTDVLIDFFANADVQNNTLALALLQPLKRQNHNAVESEDTLQSSPNDSYISELPKHEEKIDKAFGPIKSLVEELSSLGLQTQAHEVTARIDELKKFIKKSFEDAPAGEPEIKYVESLMDAAELSGDEAFLRDHNLLPKLIVHPNMTLVKVLTVYPNLPYPTYFNKKAKVKILLDEWLPFVAKYSREYLVKTTAQPDVHELVVSIMKMLSTKNPRKKRKKNKDQPLVLSLDVAKDCSSKN